MKLKLLKVKAINMASKEIEPPLSNKTVKDHSGSLQLESCFVLSCMITLYSPTLLSAKPLLRSEKVRQTKNTEYVVNKLTVKPNYLNNR